MEPRAAPFLGWLGWMHRPTVMVRLAPQVWSLEETKMLGLGTEEMSLRVGAAEHDGEVVVVEHSGAGLLASDEPLLEITCGTFIYAFHSRDRYDMISSHPDRGSRWQTTIGSRQIFYCGAPAVERYVAIPDCSKLAILPQYVVCHSRWVLPLQLTGNSAWHQCGPDGYTLVRSGGQQASITHAASRPLSLAAAGVASCPRTAAGAREREAPSAPLGTGIQIPQTARRPGCRYL